MLNPSHVRHRFTKIIIVLYVIDIQIPSFDEPHVAWRQKTHG